MKKAFTITLLFFFQFSIAQNLVSNWSFEDTISCPLGIGDITKAVGWSSYKETPDYFNNCNNDTIGTSFAGVPNNFFGYQYANTGVGYSGLYVYYEPTLNFREILGSQLNQTMVIGQKYFASFFISRSFSQIVPYLNIATNKVGIRFSTVAFSFSNPITINNISHIYSDSVNIDTLNWMRISGSFVADSAYQFIEIGNFFTDSATILVHYDSTSIASYYYIDDIRVSTDSNFVNSITVNLQSKLIKIYPNPARDWIVLEGKGIKSVEITNALGSTIGSYPTTAFTLRHQISLSSLSRGIYLLKINMIDERFQIHKFIIQK